MKSVYRFPKVAPGRREVGFRVYNSYYESGQSGLKGRNSYWAFARREAFDRVFGVAAAMGNTFVPENAFQSGNVIAVIKRGNAVWNYHVEQVTADNNTLRVRYRATLKNESAANFASPLIVAVNGRNFDLVVFIENGKKVGEAKVTR